MTPDLLPLMRLDSFPYRHRLADLMTRPVLDAAPADTLAQACAAMDKASASALVILDPDRQLCGIVTQSDIVSHLARHGMAALALPLHVVMSAPVQTVPASARLSTAIARMDRLKLRHLVVVDDDGAPVGMVTPRQVLDMRARRAVTMGDDIAMARSPDELRAARHCLTALAGGLRQDGTPTADIAAIISGILRDITARAAGMTEEALSADGWGPAPAAYALLVLGSAGRGESLLTFDQDNALVHDGDATHDIWFAEFGRRLNDLLDHAGIALCQGEVMVRNPFWRRSLEGWRQALRGWVFQPEMQTLLNVDIFFDMVCVAGHRALALELRRIAFETAAQSPFFLQLLSQSVARLDSPLGAFGRFKTEDGRFDAKKYGLLPLVSTARARAIQSGIVAAGTAERYGALAERGMLHEDDLASLLTAHETILSAMLDQQLADIAADRPPGTRIAPAAFSTATQQRLKEAFQRIKLLREKAGNQITV